MPLHLILGVIFASALVSNIINKNRFKTIYTKDDTKDNTKDDNNFLSSKNQSIINQKEAKIIEKTGVPYRKYGDRLFYEYELLKPNTGIEDIEYIKTVVEIKNGEEIYRTIGKKQDENSIYYFSFIRNGDKWTKEKISEEEVRTIFGI